MKKAVTLFYFLSMFLLISCFTGTEPEDENENEILTLADRTGVYTGLLINKTTGEPTTTNAMLVLHADGTGAYATTSLTQLIVGSHESTGILFHALRIPTTGKPTFAGTITFDLNDPNKVIYDTDPTDDLKPKPIPSPESLTFYADGVDGSEPEPEKFDPTAVTLTKK